MPQFGLKFVTDILVDANALLRYLLNDIPEQADQVEALFDEAERGDVRLITHAHIVAEIVWVLSSFYTLLRQQVRQQVEAIVHTPGESTKNRGVKPPFSTQGLS